MNPAAMLLLAAALNPGDIISVQAKCQTDQGSTTRATCQIVIKSRIYSGRPIFLTQGWGRSNHKADGMLVRAFVNVGGQAKLVDGIQMSDGRVWVNDHAYPRTDSVAATPSAQPAAPEAQQAQTSKETPPTHPPEKAAAPEADKCPK